VEAGPGPEPGSPLRGPKRWRWVLSRDATLRYSINATLDGRCGKLPRALAELGLIDEHEFVLQPGLVGHGPTLFAGLSMPVDVKLVSRLEFGSGAVAIRYEPRR
jgi:hypothetical protein